MDKRTYFHLLITGQLDDAPQEPNDYEFMRLLKQQEEAKQKTAVSRPQDAAAAKGKSNGLQA